MTELNVGSLLAEVSLSTVSFDRGYARVVKSLAQLEAEFGGTVKASGSLDEALGSIGKSATDAAVGLGRATKSSTENASAQTRAAAAADRQATAQERVAGVMDAVSGASARVQQAVLRQVAADERLVGASSEAGSATRAQATETARLASAQASAIGSTDRLAAAQKAAFVSGAARVKELGASVTHNVTLPVVAAVGVSADLASKFNASMTKIQTQAGGSAKDVRLLSNEVLNLSKTAEQGPSDLASALYHLKSVGLDNVDAMHALAQASNLAAVGNDNVEDSANALAGAWRTGIRGATSFHDAVKTVNAIVGAGNMTLSDLTAALGTGILPTAKTFGLTFKDVGSALALFTDEGVPAAAAATRLRMGISLLGAPSAAAVMQLKTIGITQNELGHDMRQPNGLITAIGDLKDHLDQSGLSATKQAALLSRAFGGGRSSASILSMINNFDVLQKKQAQVTAGMNKYDQAVAAQRLTPAAQFKELEANLERAAILLGNAVLPELVKVTGSVTDAVKSFTDLSSTQKEIAGWGIGVLAAMGPVLTLGSRLALVGGGISRFTVGATASFTKMAGATEEQSAVISTAAGRISTAIGAAGLGVAVGELTSNSSTATKDIGLLGSALSGAAIGAAGGPWGIAIGAAAGAVGDLATQWFHSGDAAKASSVKAQAAAAASARATQVEKQAVSGLLSQLQAVNGQYGKQYRNAVIQSLQGDGTLRQGQAVGINANLVTNAALGKQGALASIMTKLYKSSPDLGLLTPQMQKFVKSLDNATGETGKAEKAYELYMQAQGKGIVRAQQLTGGIANLAKELGKHGTALTTDTDNQIASSAYAARNTAIIGANIQEINKSAVAQLAHGKSVAQVATNYENQIGALQASTKTLGFNQDAVTALAEKYGSLPAKVITYLQKQGVLPNDIQAILDKYNALPKTKNTDVTANAGTALGVLNQVHNSLNNLRSKTITITTRQSEINQYESFNPSGKPNAAGSRATYRRADGTVPPNTVATVGEGASHTWEGLVTDSRGRATIYSNSQAKAMGFSTPTHYAKGSGDLAGAMAFARAQNPKPYQMGDAGPSEWDCSGLVSGVIDKYLGRPQGRLFWTGDEGSVLSSLGFKSGAGNNSPFVVGWEHDSRLEHTTGMVGGLKFEAYGDKGVPLGQQIRVGGGARDPRTFPNVMHLPGSSADTGPTGDGSSAGGGAITKHGKGTSATFSYGGTSYDTLKEARSARSSAAKSAAKSQAQGARSAASSFRGLTRGVDRTGSNIESTSDIRSALGDVDKGLRGAGIPKTVIAQLAKDNTAILAAAKIRNQAAAHLANANAALARAQKMKASDAKAFASAVTGSFDVTSAGTMANGRITAGSLFAAQTQAVSRAKLFVKDIDRLADMKIFPPSYLRELAGEGPAALPTIEALLAMPKSKLNRFADQQRTLSRLGQSAGARVSSRLDNGRISDARTADRLAREDADHRQKVLLGELRGWRKDINSQLADLHMKIDWKTGELTKAVATDGRKSSHRGSTSAHKGIRDN